MTLRKLDNGKFGIFCDECGWRISHRYHNALEGDLDPEDGGLDPRHAEQHLCPRCYDLIWARTVSYHCHTDCRNAPCERGGDCWVNPWPNIMNLCFIGRRLGHFHPAIQAGMELIEEVKC